MGRKNRELSKILNKIAVLLELEEVEWEPRAYRKAARSIKNLDKDIGDIYKEDELQNIEGVGKSISKSITEYLEKGKIKKYEKLKKKWPKNVDKLIEIEDLGPKKVKRLIKKLKISNVNDLKKAAKKGEIRKIEGFGKKTEEHILHTVHAHKQGRERILLNKALPIAEEIINELKRYAEIINYAGSLRRWKETVGDIDILAVSNKSGKIMEKFANLEGVRRVVSKGETRSQIVLEEEEIQVDIRVIPKKSYAAALQYFTGNKEHNIEIRKIAKSKGYKLSEYGLFKGKRKIGCESEEKLYKKLGLQYPPPEIRNNRGEIRKLDGKKIPELVKLEDIKGDLQMHSKFSDGNSSLKEMVNKCHDMGYDYMVITDHSESRKISGGMDKKKIKKQWKEIDKIKKKIKVLKGAEVDILKNGKLDYPDKILKKLDFVAVSIHSNFKQSKKKMTERITKAFQNKYVNMFAHPTGRLIGKREGYDFDFEKICEAAEENNVILEINSNPQRLDLNDSNIFKAKKYNIKFAINTDSHSTSNLSFIQYGVGQARRGWLTKRDVVNTLSYNKLKKIL